MSILNGCLRFQVKAIKNIHNRDLSRGKEKAKRILYVCGLESKVDVIGIFSFFDISKRYSQESIDANGI